MSDDSYSTYISLNYSFAQFVYFFHAFIKFSATIIFEVPSKSGFTGHGIHSNNYSKVSYICSYILT